MPEAATQQRKYERTFNESLTALCPRCNVRNIKPDETLCPYCSSEYELVKDAPAQPNRPILWITIMAVGLLLVLYRYFFV